VDDSEPTDAPERTIVTIKGILVEAWNAARDGAKKQDEPMNVWLARAIFNQVKLEAGLRELPPEKPIPLTPDQITARTLAVASFQQSVASMKAASGRATGISVLHRHLASLQARLDEAEGPLMRTISAPKQRRLARQTNGQTPSIQSWRAGLPEGPADD
jgi:hypothetical protein